MGQIGSHLKKLNCIALHLCQNIQTHHIDSSQNHLFIESLKVALKKTGVENKKTVILLDARYAYSIKYIFYLFL